MDKPISQTSFKEIMVMADTIKGEQDIVPKGCLNNPVKISCIIKAGYELGVSPLTALRCISIVCGKVFFGYDLRLGLIRKSGCKIRWKESTNEKAVIELWYEKDKSDLSPFEYTIEDAKLAGLANKPEWKKQPKVMLRARVLSAAARAFVGELAGSYDLCEMDEIKQGRVIDVEVSDCQTGEEKLLSVLKAKKEKAKEMEAKAQEAVIEAEDVSSSADSRPNAHTKDYIDFDILINDAVSQSDLSMIASKVGANNKITDDEKEKLRNAYMVKSNEIKSGG